MRMHNICKKKQKNVNLYLFYGLSIILCLGRFLTLITVFLCCVLNEFYPLDYFNYGFYTATFSIILIAFSQINTINTATLRTRYINKFYSGQKPEISRLNKQLFWINTSNIFIDIITMTYFAVAMARLHNYYSDKKGLA